MAETEPKTPSSRAEYDAVRVSRQTSTEAGLNLALPTPGLYKDISTMQIGNPSDAKVLQRIRRQGSIGGTRRG